MNRLTKIKVLAAPRQALFKLARAGVPVYGCKKQGAFFLFSVPDNFLKKVFAIFSSPCYNISVERKSAAARLKNFAAGRAALVAGCLLFAACAFLSNIFIFKVEVTGSGAYLKNAVLEIASSCGVRRWAAYGGVDKVSVISRVLELPSVTFCSVHKSGSVLYIDVQAQREEELSNSYLPLYADCDGTVEKIVAVCGTAIVEKGSFVKRGDALIAPYSAVNEGDIVPCIASGYAVISRTVQLSYAADSESRENLSAAYASALLYADGEIVRREHTVSFTSEGVVYNVELTYLHTVSINFE